MVADEGGILAACVWPPMQWQPATTFASHSSRSGLGFRAAALAALVPHCLTASPLAVLVAAALTGS